MVGLENVENVLKKKGPTMAKTKTFWLARDVYYNLSSNPMMLKNDYFFPTEKAKVFEYFSAETAKILGLPTLRKHEVKGEITLTKLDSPDAMVERMRSYAKHEVKEGER
jgi:hypothetical protein